MDEIKIGTPVYHVEEYRLTNYELKQKGFEGFDNYGLEVVESIVIAVTDTHFDVTTKNVTSEAIRIIYIVGGDRSLEDQYF